MKQIDKQIEASEKNIEKFKKNIFMYSSRIEKNIEKLKKTVPSAKNTEEFLSINPWEFKGKEFDLFYSACSSKENLEENQKKLEREKTHFSELVRRRTEIQNSANEEKRKYDIELEELFSEKLLEFKKDWFLKMENWHKSYWKYIKSIIPSKVSRVKKIREIISEYFILMINNHEELYQSLEKERKACNQILCSDVALMPKHAYMKKVSEKLANDWKSSVRILVKKCSSFGLNKKELIFGEPTVTERGFEIWIEDNTDRRIYARIIWCAEHSVMVSPHMRYIVTSKSNKDE